MKRISDKEIADFIKGRDTFAIFGHVSPDGDCYGASFGLKLGLEKLGKKVRVYLSDTYPEFIAFLKDYMIFDLEDEYHPVDAVIILDTPNWQRIDRVEILDELERRQTEMALIDHHQAGDLAEKCQLVWQDPYFSSTSEMVLAILKNLQVKPDKVIATLLLTGIETDTSSFQNQNTTREAFEAAALLVSSGARLGTIINNAFLTKNIEVVKLYGLLLERLTYNPKHKSVATYVTEKDLIRHGLNRGAVSGIANYLNSIQGASIVFLIYAADNGRIEVSTRTRAEHVDVEKLAKLFGGGGHKKASGFSTKGKLTVRSGLALIE